MCVCVTSSLSPDWALTGSQEQLSICPNSLSLSHFALFSSFISCFLSSHCLFSSPLSSSLFTLFFPPPLSSPATPFHIVVSFHLLSPCLPSSFLSSGLFPIPLLLMFSFAPLLCFTFLSFYHLTSSFISNLPLLSLPPHSHCFLSLFFFFCLLLSSAFLSSLFASSLPFIFQIFPLLSSPLPLTFRYCLTFTLPFCSPLLFCFPLPLCQIRSMTFFFLSFSLRPPSSLTLSHFQVTGNEILAYWLISTCPQFDLCMCLSLFLTHTPIHPLTHTHAYTFLNFPHTYASLSGDSRTRVSMHTHSQSNNHFTSTLFHPHSCTHGSLHSTTLYHLTNRSQLAPARRTHNLSKLFNNVINHFALTSRWHSRLHKWSESGLPFKGPPSYDRVS